IGFEVAGGLGVVTLNRPKALNAVTLDMVHGLDEQLRQWADADEVLAVMIRSTSARAFAAGGDIRRLYDAGRAGDPCRSEERTSELKSLMRTSYAVFCLKK